MRKDREAGKGRKKVRDWWLPISYKESRFQCYDRPSGQATWSSNLNKMHRLSTLEAIPNAEPQFHGQSFLKKPSLTILPTTCIPLDTPPHPPPLHLHPSLTGHVRLLAPGVVVLRPAGLPSNGGGRILEEGGEGLAPEQEEHLVFVGGGEGEKVVVPEGFEGKVEVGMGEAVGGGKGGVFGVGQLGKEGSVLGGRAARGRRGGQLADRDPAGVHALIICISNMGGRMGKGGEKEGQKRRARK